MHLATYADTTSADTEHFNEPIHHTIVLISIGDKHLDSWSANMKTLYSSLDILIPYPHMLQLLSCMHMHWSMG